MQVRDPSAPLVPTSALGSCLFVKLSRKRGCSKIVKLRLGLWQLHFSPAHPDLLERSKWVTLGLSPRDPNPQMESGGMGIREAGPTRAREQGGSEIVTDLLCKNPGCPQMG